MPTTDTSITLPSYQQFSDTLALIALPISASELHGVLCGYLAAGVPTKGEMYLRALILNQNDEAGREVALALFHLFTITQQQMTQLGFEFQLFLPEDNQSLSERAQAFSEWCEGFSQGLTLSSVDYHQIEDEETQDAIQHMIDFAQLDYEALSIDETDEQALMEITEYARMAVLHIHTGLQQDASDSLH